MATEIRPDEVAPELIALWNRLHLIPDQDGERTREEDVEYHDVWGTLHLRLGLRPWQKNPYDAADPEPPGWMNSDRRADYARAHRLYTVLEAAAEAAEPPEPVKRTSGRGKAAEGTSAARMRRLRRRERRGLRPVTIEIDQTRVLEAAIVSNALSEQAALDPAAVATALGGVIDAWAERWLAEAEK